MLGDRKKLEDAELLAEIEDLLRNIPDSATISHDTDESYSWLGRVSAVIEMWSFPKYIPLGSALGPTQATVSGGGAIVKRLRLWLLTLSSKIVYR